MTQKKSIYIGALFVFLAAICFATMGAFVKYLTSYVTDDQIVFMRNFISLLILLPFLFTPSQKSLATKHLGNHLIRSLASLFSLYCLFYAIRHIYLADAILLNNTMPLFVPFIMFFWKKEKIPKKIFLPLFVSFIGIVIILRPTTNIFHIGSLLALLSAVFMAISTCGIRELGKNEPLYRILFYLFVLGTIIAAIPLFYRWQTPTPLNLLFFFFVAIFGFMYQLLLTMGYRYAPPSTISPLIYVAVIVSSIYDWLFWNQKPALFSLVGLILVAVGTIYSMKVEHKDHPNE